MKKFLLLVLSAVFVLTSLSCSSNASNDKVVKVGFAGESDYQIWNPIVTKLAEEGIKVELVSFSDYTIPNQALTINANVAQTKESISKKTAIIRKCLFLKNSGICQNSFSNKRFTFPSSQSKFLIALS